MVQEKVDNADVNQNQVNDIFGDASQSVKAYEGEHSGIEFLLNRNVTSTTRLPMLEVVFDRFVRVLSNSYRGFTSFTVDVELEKQETMRFGDYIDSLPIPTMIAVIKAVEWDNYALVTVDSPLTYSLVDILFGGRKLDPSLKVEGRPYTSIEQSIVQSITEIFINDLSSAFEQVTPVTLVLDRLESNPKFATVSRLEDIVIIARIKVKMENRGGEIDLVLPYSTIEPVKKILQRSFISERSSKDPAWSRHMEEELKNTKLQLSVVLNGVTSTIKNMASLKVGDTIVLDKEPTDDIYLTINKMKVSAGKLGKVANNVALKLSEGVDLKKFKS